MAKTTDTETTRKTQYEKGHEDARKEFLLLLAIFIDVFPNVPSNSTLARFGYFYENGGENIAVTIAQELKRLAATVKKSSKVEAAV